MQDAEKSFEASRYPIKSSHNEQATTSKVLGSDLNLKISGQLIPIFL
jgi:hypothetical protein